MLIEINALTNELPALAGKGTVELCELLAGLGFPVDGVDVSRVHGGDEVKYRLKKVGFVFQSYYLIPNMTALENVMLPMELSGVKPGERETRARELLASGNSKVVDVALESGYKSLSLFNLMFARRYGTSPGKWRQKNGSQKKLLTVNFRRSRGCKN